jgi:hypothetical protein
VKARLTTDQCWELAHAVTTFVRRMDGLRTTLTKPQRSAMRGAYAAIENGVEELLVLAPGYREWLRGKRKEAA